MKKFIKNAAFLAALTTVVLGGTIGLIAVGIPSIPAVIVAGVVGLGMCN
jgi:hydrogenase/urease accessory protein HupE